MPRSACAQLSASSSADFASAANSSISRRTLPMVKLAKPNPGGPPIIKAQSGELIFTAACRPGQRPSTLPGPSARGRSERCYRHGSPSRWRPSSAATSTYDETPMRACTSCGLPCAGCAARWRRSGRSWTARSRTRSARTRGVARGRPGGGVPTVLGHARQEASPYRRLNRATCPLAVVTGEGIRCFTGMWPIPRCVCFTAMSLIGSSCANGWRARTSPSPSARARPSACLSSRRSPRARLSSPPTLAEHASSSTRAAGRGASQSRRRSPTRSSSLPRIPPASSAAPPAVEPSSSLASQSTACSPSTPSWHWRTLYPPDPRELFTAAELSASLSRFLLFGM